MLLLRAVLLRSRYLMSFLLTALIMFAFWILLSGEFTLTLLISGVVSSLFVAYLSHDLLIGKGKNIPQYTMNVGRFLIYLPWLLWQIILANIDLVYRTLHPKMPIEPMIIRFKNNFKTEIGMATLANSITLTPGTVTIDVGKDEFIVHAIAKGPAEDLLSGNMEERVKRIGEGNV